MIPTVRPATAADVAAASDDFPDLLADRWREGGNRRSLVAIDDSGRVLGHCRGIDNAAHPTSRTLLVQTLPGAGDEVREALVRAQLDVSTLPLTMKIHDHEAIEIALARRLGGVAVQVTPPWRYEVGPRLRAWAAEHGGATEPIRGGDREAVRQLETDHYIAQHAAWSPATSREQMLDYFADDHEAGSASGWDSERSVVVRREGRVVAAGLLWPEDDGGREVTLLAWPYEGPQARADKEACLAAVVASADDGDVLCIDSHLTEALESRMMAEVAEWVGDERRTDWMAIVRLPVAGAARPRPIPAELVPSEASWVLDLR